MSEQTGFREFSGQWRRLKLWKVSSLQANSKLIATRMRNPILLLKRKERNASRRIIPRRKKSSYSQSKCLENIRKAIPIATVWQNG